MSGYIIRKLTQRNGRDDLTIAMVVEEEELGEDRGMERVIIPESTETGKRLWNWAQREGKQLPLCPAVFGQPAGIQGKKLVAFTKAAQRQNLPKNEHIVAIDGIAVVVPEEDLFTVSTGSFSIDRASL